MIWHTFEIILLLYLEVHYFIQHNTKLHVWFTGQTATAYSRLAESLSNARVVQEHISSMIQLKAGSGETGRLS